MHVAAAVEGGVLEDQSTEIALSGHDVVGLLLLPLLGTALL
jgi:hypothetical protein